MIVASIFLVILILIVVFFLVTNLPVFGSTPKGSRLDKIQHLNSYQNGAIKNLVDTPMQPEGVGFGKILFKFLTKKKVDTIPDKPLPHVAPNLDGVATLGAPELIWFGHSTYLIKIEGKRILVDPVFSKRASPFNFIGPEAFEGTDFVKAEDFKNIDILLITHDHFDHLDYETILKIAPNVKDVVTSLGVAAHLESWKVFSGKINELAWEEHLLLEGFKFTAVSARHFSGRKFKRNQTLWSAFVLETAEGKLFLGGDSGYEKHFKDIGNRFGPFEIALLECGQYNEYWPFIHMFPEQTVQAAKDLKAKVFLPVHWGKFSLAMHPWNEPIQRAFKEAEKLHVAIVAPILGETIVINEVFENERWWNL